MANYKQNYVAALENAILQQQENGLVCPTCGKTRVEHYFKKKPDVRLIGWI